MNDESLLTQLQEWMTAFGLRILMALLILLVGLRVAALLQRLVDRAMERGRMDATLTSFSSSLTYVGTIVLVTIAALAQLGIQTASFIAILGSAGLAIGLALQGSLANFAAGILIIIFRPFDIDDYIEGAGVAGFVEEIHILTTTLKTIDNRTIIVPNRKLFEENITNYSAKSVRRLDLVFRVTYQSDLDQVKQVILAVLAQDDRILKEPPPEIGVLEWADIGIRIAVRPWVNTTDYWGVYFFLQEAMKKRFDAEGIHIPSTLPPIP